MQNIYRIDEGYNTRTSNRCTLSAVTGLPHVQGREGAEFETASDRLGRLYIADQFL